MDGPPAAAMAVSCCRSRTARRARRMRTRQKVGSPTVSLPEPCVSVLVPHQRAHSRPVVPATHRSRSPPMATAESTVKKPDTGPAQALHLHRRARAAARVDPELREKELAPHAEEWEETTFPDSVFPRMGELGFLGLDKPEEYGGQGGDYYSGGAGRGDQARELGGLAMGVASRPTWRCRRSWRSAPRSRSSSGRRRRSAARRSFAWGSPSPTPDRMSRESRRARCATATTG